MEHPKAPPGVNVAELLRGEADLLEQLEAIRKIKAFLGLGDCEASEHSTSTDPAPRRRRPSTRRASTRKAKKSTWLDDLVSILREDGSPMHWSVLYDGIRQRRPEVSAKQPAATIRSYIRRAHEKGDMRIVPVGQGKFGLSEWGEAVPEHDGT